MLVTLYANHVAVVPIVGSHYCGQMQHLLFITAATVAAKSGEHSRTAAQQVHAKCKHKMPLILLLVFSHGSHEKKMLAMKFTCRGGASSKNRDPAKS